MTKPKKIFTALLLAGAVAGGAVYYTQFYPEQAEIRQLEKNYQLAMDYGDSKAYKALENYPPERLRVLAEKGYAVAQYRLGEFYRNKEQPDFAEKWFNKAAEQKLAGGYLGLAFLARDKKNETKQEEYLTKASELGSGEAKCHLASNIWEKDKLTAVMLYEQAAKQGYPMAQATLARLYFLGLGVNQDWAKAFEWFEKAYQSEVKHRDGKSRMTFLPFDMEHLQDLISYLPQDLAPLYLLGIGTPPNPAKAEAMLKELAEVPDYRKRDLKWQTMDELKIGLIAMKDKIKDENAKQKIEQLEEEFLTTNNPKIYLLLGEKEKNKSKAKEYFGQACDAGDQKGCDKYRELNEQGVK